MRISLRTLLFLISLPLLLIAASYVQWGVLGLPTVQMPLQIVETSTQPFGFPPWLRITHYVNLLFLVLLVRSGLQILADHPRLYWNVHCTPGTEWLRLTPIEAPRDRVWTAKDESRYLTPWIGLPGYRHTIGMARHWHFFSVLFWVGNGLIFGILLLWTGQWKRLVPTTWQIVPEAWAVFVHYATLHLPAEPNGFYDYNALQKLTYFGVVFVLAPLAIVTGPSMSPAFTARFTWYPKLPGNRQIGRSLHFLVMCAFVLFTMGHVIMVAITGLTRNLNHIVLGTDNANLLGLVVGLLGFGVIVILNVWANWMTWRHPRIVQHAARAIVSPVMRFLLDHPAPVAEFGSQDISPFFWINGKMPTSSEWKGLAAGNFKDYRLKIYGLVENPLELSLVELQDLGKKTQVTLHHCIQGWSGIAQWGGLPVKDLINLVRPRPNANAIVFYSFGEGMDFNTGLADGQYYDSLSIENALNPQTLLAYEMNYEPLSYQHGAPLRLRVENQLGFKMVKWIQGIEFVESVRAISKGEGGYAEDKEYFGELANI